MSLDRRVVITGVGLLCPLGDSPSALRAALRERDIGSPPTALTQATTLFACVPPDSHLNGRNAYSLDRPARLLAAVAQLALSDSGWTPDELLRQDVGVFVGTMFSSMHTISRFDCQGISDGPTYVSPVDFANTVINAPSSQAAIWHGLRGVNNTIATGASSGLEAIGCAASAVREDRVGCLLAGGVEELSPEAVRALSEAGVLCGRGHPSRPFDAHSGGLVFSEGAALLVLEEAQAARERGARILAEIRGHGRAFDVSRRCDEQQSVRSIARSMRLAMEQAKLGPGEIDLVAASANGLARIDRQEALAITAVFEASTDPTPVCAVKSVLGESLGAAGPLQCATMIEAMRGGFVPTMLDLRQFPDKVVPCFQHDDPPIGTGRTCLINSLSYDGHSCSLVLASSSA